MTSTGSLPGKSDAQIWAETLLSDVNASFIKPDREKFRDLQPQFNTTIMDRFNIAYHLSLIENINQHDFEVAAIKLHTKAEVTNLFIGKTNRGKQTMIVRTILAHLFYNKDNKKIEYIALGPSYSSADGEYRSGFISYDSFVGIFTPERVKLLEPIYNVIHPYFNENTYTIGYEMTNHNKEFEKQMEKTDAIGKVLISTLLLINTTIDLRFIGNNTSEGYVKALQNPEVQRVINQNKAGPLRDLIMDMVSNLLDLANDPARKSLRGNGRLGIKIMPLTKYSLENMGKPIINLWRELWINEKLNPLVLNFVARGLPLTGTWTLIHAYNPNLFNNVAQKMKYEFTEIVSDTIDAIEEARAGLYSWDDLEKEEVYLSAKIESLNRHVQVPINYARIHMDFTDIAVAVVSEYCGFTFGNINMILSTHPIDNPLGNMFSEKRVFDRYLFEIMYNLYVINHRAGVIHTDLHLNNVCLHVRDHPTQMKEHLQIEVGGKKYSLKEGRLFPCIIDFSRALVDPRLLDHLEPEDRKALDYDQRARIHDVYAQTFPEFYESFSQKLDIIITDYFPMVFDIFRAIDLHRFCTAFRAMSKSFLATSLPGIDHKFIEGYVVNTLTSIIDRTETVLIHGMKSLYTEKTNLYTANPNLSFINTMFSEYLYTGATIFDSDWLNTDNNLVYNMDYDNLPNSLKYEYLVEKGVKQFENTDSGKARYQAHLEYLKKMRSFEGEDMYDKVREKMIAEYEETMQRYRKKSKKYSVKQLELAETYYFDT